jgi:HPt (histidine-containing phosphotransfer) domain-containing protein
MKMRLPYRCLVLLMTPKEEAKIGALLASLWERSLPLLRERLDSLDRAATSMALGSLTEASRTEALDIAHKLSGSLGMFGYDDGTGIARQIEHALSYPSPPASNHLTTLILQLRQVLSVE